MPKYLMKIVDDVTDRKRMSGYRLINDEWGADTFVVDPDLFLEVTSSQFTYAKNLLDAGATITYPSSASLPLTPDDLTIVNVTPLAAAKIRAYSNIASQMNNRLMSNLALINLYKFVIADNILRNAGYTITDDNREQVYLDIVNSGVQKHITALEQYLDVKDRMSTDLWFFNNFITWEDNLRAATTVEEVQTLHDNAMGYFS